MDGFLGSTLLGLGYLLAFAAFWQGGRYAARPWKALAA